MINFLVWLVFGALAGWVASIITGKNRKMDGVANVIIGIFGAFVGAGIMGISGFPVPDPISVTGFLIAVAGAVALIFAMGLVRK